MHALQITIWNLSNLYRSSVGCEINIFFTWFSSFAAATSLVSEASKLSEKKFSANQNFTIFET